MEQTSMKLEGNTQLSYSSMTLLKGCEQRYVHYKVLDTPVDSDCEVDQLSFIVGTSFHAILEWSEHQKPEKIGADLEKCVKDFNLPEDQVGLVHAMVLKYLRLHRKSNLECVKCEYQISNKSTIGYVDVIFKEKDSGKWWICDLKTAKTFWSTLPAKLPKDRQLNLYGYYYKHIAKDLGLDHHLFQGCRYRVTTKSSAKQRQYESYVEYVKRITDNNIKSYDVIIPKEKLSLQEVFNEHKSLHRRSLALRKGSEPTRNYGYCDTYFKPCPYFSQCHGDLFSNKSEDLEILKEE